MRPLLDHDEYNTWCKNEGKSFSKSSTVGTRNQRGQVIMKRSPKKGVFQSAQTLQKMDSDNIKLFGKV